MQCFVDRVNVQNKTNIPAAKTTVSCLSFIQQSQLRPQFSKLPKIVFSCTQLLRLRHLKLGIAGDGYSM